VGPCLGEGPGVSPYPVSVVVAALVAASEVLVLLPLHVASYLAVILGVDQGEPCQASQGEDLAAFRVGDQGGTFAGVA